MWLIIEDNLGNVINTDNIESMELKTDGLHLFMCSGKEILITEREIAKKFMKAIGDVLKMYKIYES